MYYQVLSFKNTLFLIFSTIKKKKKKLKIQISNLKFKNNYFKIFLSYIYINNQINKI